jgi:hypothetical protein
MFEPGYRILRYAGRMVRTASRALSVIVATVIAPGLALAGPIDAIARVAKARDGGALTLTFQADPCTLTAATSEGEQRVPLRQVTWSMTKETDGTNDAIVTARCANSEACVAAGKPQLRYSFRLATGAREARAMLADLKRLIAHCA